ncbi:MAG TPA: M28 family peptidase [Gemmatimonadota bacterium]|nr:M28 family peptidase [Gemmatimonadota bacterium]
MTRLAPALLAGLLWASSTPAQTGFTSEGRSRQRALEAGLVAAIRAADLDSMARVLSAAPHVAGTPGQAAVRDTLVAWLEAWGLEPAVETYEVFLPHATGVEVRLVAPESIDFLLVEEPVPGDPVTRLEPYPWLNGYSAPGRVEAEVVYAGWGLHADYDRLAEMGVEVRGRIVVARYGLAYRGIKARLAEERGAAALLLYSDPDDDGYVQGDVYPEGPWRPWSGVQRGSVMVGAGDPATPAGPSLAGAPRLAVGAFADRLPGIPVLPVSYRVAGEILSRVRGADIPVPAWQGGLPFRYHVGPGPARVRVRAADDRAGPGGGVKAIHDVVAVIEGTEWPEEIVVIGAHIDAWGAGANDNVSGTISVLAAARAIRAAAAENPPRRTIVVAGWDGEEWGLLGSTEWTEEHAARLEAGGVAYLNQDAVGGTRFGAGAAPLLARSVREAALAVPGEGGSLLDEWRGGEAEAEVGDLGGGSDFQPFYQRLGIPSASYGFGASGGIYHSAYDTHRWMSRFGDPGYRNHARTAQLTAVLATRLANAEVLPYDVSGLAGRLDSLWAPLRAMTVAEAGAGEEDLAPLDGALEDLAAAGEELASARDRYLTGRVDAARSARANRILLGIERGLGRESGPFGDGSNRSLTFAGDPRNGYATLALPGVATAVREASPERVRNEVAELAARLAAAADRAREAARQLGGGSPGPAGAATFSAPERRADNPSQEVDAW